MHPQLIRNRRAILPQKPLLSQRFQKLSVSGWTLPSREAAETHAARMRDRCPHNAELITVDEIAAAD
jgi:hypothetical protein